MQFSFSSICELYTIDEVFSDIVIPNGMDKETLVNTIFDRCMLYQPLYVDMPILNSIIRNFFKKNLTNFEKLWYLYNLEYEKDYNPIWNKDGTYTEKESYSNTRNDEVLSSSSTDSNSTDGTVEQVAPYDTSSWQNRDKTDTRSTQNIDNSGKQNEKHSEDFNKTFEHKEQGNIGITTTMTMIKEEMEAHSDTKYNVYDIIALKFYDELFIHY